MHEWLLLVFSSELKSEGANEYKQEEPSGAVKVNTFRARIFNRMKTEDDGSISSTCLCASFTHAQIPKLQKDIQVICKKKNWPTYYAAVLWQICTLRCALKFDEIEMTQKKSILIFFYWDWTKKGIFFISFSKRP